MNFDRNINFDSIEKLFDLHKRSILNEPEKISNALDLFNPQMNFQNDVQHESIYALKIREYAEQLFNLKGAKTL